MWTKICLHCQNPEKIDFATMLYFEKVFVFCRLTNKSVLEWFLLIMCKKHTLSRGTNLFGRNTFFVFDQEEKISKCTEQILYQTETSIHWRCSIKNVVRKNFAIFTVKHLCWPVFWDKVEIKLQAIRSATLLKRNSNTDVFLWILIFEKISWKSYQLQWSLHDKYWQPKAKYWW